MASGTVRTAKGLALAPPIVEGIVAGVTGTLADGYAAAMGVNNLGHVEGFSDLSSGAMARY